MEARTRNTIIVAVGLFVAGAVGAILVTKKLGPSQETVTAIQVAFADSVHTADSVAKKTADDAKATIRAKEDAARKARKDSLDKLCYPEYAASDSGNSMILDSLTKFVEAVKACPIEKMRYMAGRFKEDGTIAGNDGESFYSNLNGILEDFAARGIGSSYRNLPEAEQRKIVVPMMNLIIPEVIKHLTREQLDAYLLKLDWDRDIGSMNPHWFNTVEWPDDYYATAQMPGSAMKLSVLDAYVRKLWREQGQLIFQAAKVVAMTNLAAKPVATPPVKK